MFGGSTSVLKVCCIFLASILYTHCYHHTAKRALLFPEPFVLQLTCCIAVPSNIPNRTFALNMCMQGNFNAPSNITQFSPTVIKARSIDAFEFDRDTMYTYIIQILTGFGFEGKHCLLRSICEAAQIQMDVNHRNSILEQIIHYILTPSLDLSLQLNATSEYVHAEANGKSYGNCALEYKRCYMSVLDLITIKYIK